MPMFFSSKLLPIPDSVLEEYYKCYPELSNSSSRVALAPHSDIVFNMNLRGLFKGVKIVGALDRNIEKRGKVFYGVKALSVEDICTESVNTILVADPRYSNEIIRSIRGRLDLSHLKIIDLCTHYDIHTHRSQLADSLKPHVYGTDDVINPVRDDLALSSLQNIQVPINPAWGLGDKLCALTASRYVARSQPNSRVFFNELPDIINAFKDGLITYGNEGFVLREHYELFHRQKDKSPALNYLGCYMLGLALNFREPPQLEVPGLDPLPELDGYNYVALQPTANWAQPNLSLKSICEIIRCSPLPVIMVSDYIPTNASISKAEKEKIGRASRRSLEQAGADLRFIGNEIQMLKIIQHSSLVLTPRSASAHIAAGYKKRCIMWLPDDGENWHLNYPGWNHSFVRVRDEGVLQKIRGFLKNA